MSLIDRANIYDHKDWDFVGQSSAVLRHSYSSRQVFVSARVNKARTKMILTIMGHNGNRETKSIIDLDKFDGFKPYNLLEHVTCEGLGHRGDCFDKATLKMTFESSKMGFTEDKDFEGHTVTSTSFACQ